MMHSSTDEIPQLFFTWKCLKFIFEGWFCQIKHSYLTGFPSSNFSMSSYYLLAPLFLLRSYLVIILQLSVHISTWLFPAFSVSLDFYNLLLFFSFSYYFLVVLGMEPRVLHILENDSNQWVLPPSSDFYSLITSLFCEYMYICYI
jgi:hypothetical protein